jgi:Flp pilus assembly protein TadG
MRNLVQARNLLEDRDGQSVVELALMAPFLLALTVGAVDFGRYMYDGIQVGNAARAAVEYGAQSFATVVDSTGMKGAGTSDALALQKQSTTPILSPSTYCTCDSNQSVTVSCTTTSPSPCAANDRIDLFVKVTAIATFRPLIRYPGLPVTFPISRTSIQQVVN